jgi:hypothetical protein
MACYPLQSEDENEKEKEREKQARQEASLREREKEVRQTLASHMRERDKERELHKHDEAVQHFTALLVDLVSHPKIKCDALSSIKLLRNFFPYLHTSNEKSFNPLHFFHAGS